MFDTNRKECKPSNKRRFLSLQGSFGKKTQLWHIKSCYNARGDVNMI